MDAHKGARRNDPLGVDLGAAALGGRQLFRLSHEVFENFKPRTPEVFVLDLMVQEPISFIIQIVYMDYHGYF